jgi:hypothetical protein
MHGATVKTFLMSVILMLLYNAWCDSKNISYVFVILMLLYSLHIEQADFLAIFSFHSYVFRIQKRNHLQGATLFEDSACFENCKLYM